MVLEGDGLRIELPAAWHRRVVSRSPHLPTLQAASFPLLPDDEELGPRSTEAMADGDCFLALIEYLPGSGIEPGRVPFHPTEIGLPLDPGRFSPEIQGRTVMDHNFTQAGRPFCLHVVIAGGRLERRRRLPLLDRMLGTLRVEER